MHTYMSLYHHMYTYSIIVFIYDSYTLPSYVYIWHGLAYSSIMCVYIAHMMVATHVCVHMYTFMYVSLLYTFTQIHESL